MALEDIVFQEGDNQNFIVELPAGTLYAPVDIIFALESESKSGIVYEIPAKEIFFGSSS